MTLLLILTAAICVFAETRMKPTESYGQTGIAFRIPAGDKEEIISWWSNDDGQAFVFLPSYAELKDLRVILRKGTRAMIGDMELSDGMDCGWRRHPCAGCLQGAEDVPSATSYDLRIG